MKSVTFSDIVRIPNQPRSPFTLHGKRGPGQLALTLGLGLAALALVIHLIDPAAPLVYIVVPVLAGGLLPLVGVVPGRLEVATRFDACNLVGTLDETLRQLGYKPAARGPGALRYRTHAARWAGRGNDVGITVRDHTLEVTGPIAVLQALRDRMVC
jgi:hypothetical protein